MENRLSIEQVIDISIDFQVYINHVILTKEYGMPFPDKSSNITKYDREFISEIESYAECEIEKFIDNWYRLVLAISSNNKISREQKVFALESISCDASKLIPY